MEPKLRNLERDLVAQLKAVIESEVEKVGYKTNRQDYSVSCFLYMKNGMIIEGSALYLPSTPIDVAINMAKLTAEKRKSLPKSDFGLPGQKAYPMPDKAHAANAKARASQMVAKGLLSANQQAEIDAKANKKLGKK